MMNDGAWIREGHESHVRRGQGLSSSEPSAQGAAVRARPGILIFSRRRQLLHMNRRALELTGHLDQAEIGPVNEIRSAPVRALRAQIQKALDSRRAANIWECFELKRVIYGAGRRILARGFGLADRNSHDDSRIVIVLDEVGLRQGYKARQAPARVHLPNAHAVVAEPALWRSKEEISDALVNEELPVHNRTLIGCDG